MIKEISDEMKKYYNKFRRISRLYINQEMLYASQCFINLNSAGPLEKLKSKPRPFPNHDSPNTRVITKTGERIVE